MLHFCSNMATTEKSQDFDIKISLKVFGHSKSGKSCVLLRFVDGLFVNSNACTMRMFKYLELESGKVVRLELQECKDEEADSKQFWVN